MRKSRNLAAALVVAGVFLTACTGSEGKPPPKESPEEEALSLSVPPTTESSSVELVITPGSLDVGTEVSVYAYRAEPGETPSCEGASDPAGSAAVVEDVDHIPVTASVTGGPGVYWWVLVAPGHTSECGVEGSSTTLLATPDVSLAQKNPRFALEDYMATGRPKAGKHFAFNVGVSQDPLGGDPWSVEVVWYGPYQNQPEAVAAPCEEAASAVTATVTTARSGHKRTTIVPPEPGVYRVVAVLAPTDYSAETTTGCDETSPFVTVE